MVKISHAVANEKGSATGGKAGDQTKREVRIDTWYNGNWDCVIRFIDPAQAKKAAKVMEQIAQNENIGYCQSTRNTLLEEAEKVNFNIPKIKTKCNCDCSSMVTVALIAAGVKKEDVYKWNNCSTTRTLRSNLLKTGLVTVFTTTKYTKSCAESKTGDIYLKEGSHVLMTIEDSTVTTKQEPTEEKASSKETFKLGDKVHLKTVAKYHNNKTIPSWVFKKDLYVRRIDGNKITFSTLKTGAVTGVTFSENLTLVEDVKAKNVKVTAYYLNVRKGIGTSHPIIKVLKKGTICEIVAEKDGWGQLSQGGWISLKHTENV